MRLAEAPRTRPWARPRDFNVAREEPSDIQGLGASPAAPRLIDSQRAALPFQAEQRERRGSGVPQRRAPLAPPRRGAPEETRAEARIEKFELDERFQLHHPPFR